MNNAIKIDYKLFGLPLGILLIITMVSSGVIDSVYASHNKVKVGCKDLALVLITWDQLLSIGDPDDIAENEHILNEEGVEPDLYEVIIDKHLEDLLDKADDECNNLDNDIERLLDDIDFKLPF